METFKLMPVVIVVMFAAILIKGARGKAPAIQRSLDAADRDRRLLALTTRLAEHPVAVSSVRRRGINERFLMEIGDEEVDIRCFWPPDRPIDQLVALTYRRDVGWILEIDGPAGRGLVYAWLLDVRATTR